MMTSAEALTIMTDLVGIDPKKAEALITVTKLVESSLTKDLIQMGLVDMVVLKKILHNAEVNRYKLLYPDSEILTEVLSKLNEIIR